MKAKALVEGSQGGKTIAVGDILDADSEFLRRWLVNGLAEPLDKEAKQIAENKDQQERHHSPALQAVRRGLEARQKAEAAAKAEASKKKPEPADKSGIAKFDHDGDGKPGGSPKGGNRKKPAAE